MMAKSTAVLLSAALAILGIASGATGEESAPATPGRVAGHSIRSSDAPRLAQLLDQPAVAYDLDVTDPVFLKLQDLKNEESRKNQEMLDKLQAARSEIGDIPQIERRQSLERELSAAFAASLQHVKTDFACRQFDLFDESQLRRLCQIDVQFRGVDFFSDSDIAKQLALSDEQQTQIEAIIKQFAGKFPSLMQGSFSLESVRVSSSDPSVVQLVKQRKDQLEKIFTSDQKEAIAAIRGREIDLTRLGPGPRFDLEGIQNSKVPLSQARLLTHSAIRDELSLTTENANALVSAWKKWDEVRKEPGAGDATPPPFPPLKNTLAGGMLRQKLLRDHWKCRYMDACERFQNEAGTRLNDEKRFRLQQIEWQRAPARGILKNPEIFVLNQEQFDQCSAVFAFSTLRMVNAERETDLAKKDVAIRLVRQKVMDSLHAALSPNQWEKLLQLQGKPVSDLILNLP